MRQYRVLVKVNGAGDKTYYPQYKRFLFWRYFTDVRDITFVKYRVRCSTLDDAKGVIDNDIKTMSRVRNEKQIAKYSTGYMGSCGGL